MNLQGTPNRTKIVPIDPNNQRVDFDTISGFSGGTFTQVTVDQYGRVTAGSNPHSTPSSAVPTTVYPSGSQSVEGKQGNYGGNAPNWTPAAGNIGIAFDSSNNRIWWYVGGGWM